jgi:hypothetical protein
MRCTVIPVRDPVAERIYCILPAFGLGYVIIGGRDHNNQELNGWTVVLDIVGCLSPIDDGSMKSIQFERN